VLPELIGEGESRHLRLGQGEPVLHVVIVDVLELRGELRLVVPHLARRIRSAERYGVATEMW
jgi:hypothetical protein